jgi:imidazolonepropionase-like amidohydrolase
MRLWTWMAALAALVLPVTANAQQPADLILRHVSVVDVAHAKILPDQAVVLRGGDIVAAGPDAKTSRSWRAARTIQAKGRYLIPGLWDMHVHFGGGSELIEENKALLALYIANGVTTVRDCAGDLPYDVLKWRDAIAAGSLFGPTLYTSGPKIEGIAPIWKGTLETGSEAQVDAALLTLKALRVDFVKITDSTLKPELFLYAVRRARALGLPVSGHIPKALTVDQAIEAGISSIEHLGYAFQPDAREEDAAAAWRRIAKAGVVVTPTLNISRITANLDREDHSKDPYLAFIGPRLRATYQWRVDRAAKATPEEIAYRHAHFERMAAILPGLHAAGVTIMAGTDAGFLNSFDYPGQGLHDELALYVRYGLTPAQALATATRAGPAWFGKLDRYGSVETGKAADLVLLRANPLKDIAATREIEAVILRGKLFDRAAIDGLYAEARTKVAAWN